MKRKLSEQEQVRRNKLDTYKKMGINPYLQKLEFSHSSKTLIKEFNEYSKIELSEMKKTVSVVGRIMMSRGPFIIIKDENGKTQGYLNKKQVKEDITKLSEMLDIGDIIWFSGEVMKTNTEELTIKISELKLVSKSLKPLPEKFYGLKDVEEKRRKRYIDLIMSEQTKNNFWTRTKIISGIRKYFDNLNYMEVDTPILQPILGGASAKPFKTHFNALNKDFYLRVAPELPLKKLIVGGIDRVYEIGRLFRNEGVDTTHNPEFTTVEFYEAYSDLKGMMNRTEKLLKQLAKTLNKNTFMYGDNEINISNAFEKINIIDSIKKYSGVDFRKETSIENVKKIAKEKGIKIESYFKIGHIINEFFNVFVEDKLIQPTFIYGHPIEISPLAAKNKENPKFTERAELFICGREFANMYTELNDPIDQLERFESQLKERENGNKEANEIDLDFVEALEYGMPPTGGCGIGVDRLAMLLTNTRSIRDVLLFPHLKKKEENN